MAAPTERKRPSRISWERALSLVNAGLAIGLLLKLALHFRQGWQAETTDFTAFRAGWWLALHDPRHLYDAAAQAAVEQRFLRAIGSPGFVNGMLAFLHPPHLALAGVPIAWLGDRTGGRPAMFVWLAGNLGLLAALIAQVRRALALDRRQTLAAAAAILAFFPVIDVLSQGQFSVLLAVAAFGLAAALEGGRPWAAAAWLLVLSFKPQLFPPVLAALLARREWRALGAGAVLGLATALLTAAVLGGHVWWDWLTSVRALERMFGGGNAAVMPTIRGFLARTIPALVGPRLDAIGLGLWGAGAATVFLVLLRDARRGQDGAAGQALGFAVAVALVVSPHLYQHDLLIWVFPVVTALAAARTDPDAWRARVRLALAWPAWAMAGEVADSSDAWPPRLPVDPRLIPIAVALVWATLSRHKPGPQGDSRP